MTCHRLMGYWCSEVEPIGVRKIKRRTEVIPASNTDWSTGHSFEA